MPLIAVMPLEVWAATALLALPGGWFVLQALLDLDDVFDFFDFSKRLGTFFLFSLAMWALVGLSMIGVAAGLLLRMRPSRVLVGMLVGLLLTLVIFIDGHDVSATLALLGAGAATALVWAAPALRAHFPAEGRSPAAVVAVQVSMAAFGVFALIGAILASLVAKDQARYGVLAVLVSLTGAAMAACALRIGRAHTPTRLAATAVGLLGFVLPLTLGFTRPAMSPLPGLAAAIVVTLWLSNGVRVAFGDQPIDFQALMSSSSSGAAGPGSAPGRSPGNPSGPAAHPPQDPPQG